MFETPTYNRLTPKLFLEFIRIQAKTASMVPVITGTAWAAYYFGHFNLVNTIMYFVAQLMIAMFVTGFNNVQDYKLAVDLHYRDTYNMVGVNHLNPKKLYHLVFWFIGIAAILGLALVFLTNIFIMFVGGAAMLVSILYTYGPIPFSRYPLGEVLSGGVEGMGAFFIAVYVNVPTTETARFVLNWPSLDLNMQFANLLAFVLAAFPLFAYVGNIMFADNMSDVVQDVKNKRYTLPYYLGQKNALTLYGIVAILPFVTTIAAVSLHILPIWDLIVILALPIVIKNIKTFRREQVKETTFLTAIQNLIIFQALTVVGLLVGIILK
ncbi:1,4-dihydroxy-2-naphthoate prenyltransferase [Periweissella cryptocerci]|uniref:1,4-dihydroxy-2-naphthoate prenyltransferase n=1 Tax=Periweissella cryptocerci TaxID=2506420 RepID=A0A4P6YTI1_9LACO|nr:UbiA family prenyltransferase [Periweissella cryptocerci]QBO35973.1 1,4-dihydroxy-2-naphthoate prenyltransferase [Periweissella cryptocerci]